MRNKDSILLRFNHFLIAFICNVPVFLGRLDLVVLIYLYETKRILQPYALIGLKN